MNRKQAMRLAQKQKKPKLEFKTKPSAKNWEDINEKYEQLLLDLVSIVKVIFRSSNMSDLEFAKCSGLPYADLFRLLKAEHVTISDIATVSKIATMFNCEIEVKLKHKQE